MPCFLAHLRRRFICRELIRLACSGDTGVVVVVFVVQCSNIFLKPLEGLGQSKPNFMNGPGHMAKMAVMAINSQNLKIYSSPEPKGLGS